MLLRSTFAALLALAHLARAEAVNPRVVERYKQMLAANPVEGIALERLWKIAVDEGATEKLIAAYAGDAGFSGRMIHGHLLRKAGRDNEAQAAFLQAASLDEKSPLPPLALARLAQDGMQPRETAEWLEKAAALLPAGDLRLPDTLLQLGAAWFSAGDKTKAAQAWERTVAMAPGDTVLRRRLADAYVENFLPDAALKHLEHLAASASPAERASALQQIARLQSGAGRFEEAEQALERAVALTAPGNWLRSELLGEIIRLAQRRQTEGALEEKWKAHAEGNPRDAGAILQLVEFYERTGNPAQQRAWLEKLCALLPSNHEHRVRLARVLVQLDDIEAAVAAYDDLIAMQPGNASLGFERARLDMLREDAAAAASRVAAVLAQSPDDPTLRQRALDFYREHGMQERIEAHLREDASRGGEEEAVALATYLFSQRRATDAVTVLAGLARRGDTPQRQAALHLRAAQLLRASGETGAAVNEVRRAIEGVPDSREAWMLMGELEMARSEFERSREAFMKAYALSTDAAARMEADARMFETFRVEYSGAPERSRNSMAAEVEGFIRVLMDEARASANADGWLRVARWKAWNGDKSSAVTFAMKAADIEPRNPKPREFLARHLAAHGDAAFAAEHLRKLIEINPDGRSGYLREIARLELQRGNLDAALGILSELVRGNPGDADLVMELAAAQERGGLPDAAAANWRRALALLPAPRRREASSALLRVLQRLGRNDEAAAMLLREVDATRDGKERLARFDELLLHARERGQLEWLRQRMEERRRLRPDDYFTTVALGRVMKLLGEKTAAFELFADAAFSAPDQAEALPELVREAEALQRMDTAVRLQEHLTRVARMNEPDALLKLAALFRDTGDIEGWERTWTRAVAKFPRDPEVLRGAAAFHRDWGDSERAAVLLRKLLAVEPANLRAAAELGEIEYEAGNPAGARAAFETVMRLTKPVDARIYPAEHGGGPWTLPASQAAGRGGLAARTAARAGNEWQIYHAVDFTLPEPEDGLRLQALRRLAMLAAKDGGAALAKWVEQSRPVQGAMNAESLWALYFCGARDEVLDAIARAMKMEPQNASHRRAFLTLGMESARYERIGAWLAAGGRSAEDYADFSTAFAAFVKEHPGRVGDGMIAGLFPRGGGTRLWNSAVTLAANGHFEHAVALGMRVLEKIPTRGASLGDEIARWQLAAGRPAAARAVLESVADAGGDSFESPVYEVVRSLCELLPESQRAAFIQARLEAADGTTLHGMISRVSLLLLDGREDEAAGELGRIAALRPMGLPGFDELNKVERNAAMREWIFVMGAAGRLAEWGWPSLALRVLDRALGDEGLAQLQTRAKFRERVSFADGGHNEMWAAGDGVAELVKAARNQRDVLRCMTGGPVEVSAVFRSRSGAGAEGLVDFADTLNLFRAPSLSSQALLAAWERDRGNAGIVRRLVDAAAASGDEDLAERVRRRFLDGRQGGAGDNSPREFALELAGLLERRGAVEEALDVVERALERAPADFRLLQRQLDLLERAGRREEASAVLAKLLAATTGDAQALSAFAMKLELAGDAKHAEQVRLRGGGGGDPRLPLVFLKAGKPDAAHAALERLGGQYAAYAAMTLAEEMGLRGDAKAARGVLIATASRVTDARAQMQLRTKLLTIPGAPPQPALVARMRERLRRIAREQPGLAGGYYEFFDRYAGKFGIREEWEREVAREWSEGVAPAACAVVVLRHRLASGDATGAAALCKQMIARKDEAATAVLASLESEIARSRFPALRLDVAEARAKRAWPYAQATFDWVRLLDAQGQRERARIVLEDHSWLAGMTGGAAQLGAAWLSLGEVEKARGFLRRALRRETPSPQPATLASMARVHLAAGNADAARLLLSRAFSDASCREQEALIEYIEATSGLLRWRETAVEFGLAPAAEFRLASGVFARFEARGMLGDALALVLVHPHIVLPHGSAGPEPFAAVTCARIRALARNTGGFAAAARTLDALADMHQPDARAELAALRADEAAVTGAAVLPHLVAAVEAAPGRWEFARRLAEARLAAGEQKEARAVLLRFLAASADVIEREQALDLWERTAEAR